MEVAVKSVKDGILNDDNFVNEAETLKYVVMMLLQITVCLYYILR